MLSSTRWEDQDLLSQHSTLESFKTESSYGAIALFVVLLQAFVLLKAYLSESLN